MATFLLTWNPERWQWTNVLVMSDATRNGERLPERWSTGNTKSIKAGDRLFLLRQGKVPIGLVASGTATSAVRPEPHFDPEREKRGDMALRVNLLWDVIINPEIDSEVLAVSKLHDGPLARVNWRTRASGISVPDDAAKLLESMWRRHVRSLGYDLKASAGAAFLPEELTETVTYPEGAQLRITVNAYERNPKARQACIAHWGCRCQVCKFDFEKNYGPLGKDFIHVHHHIQQISKVGHEYQLDPINDLRPVCPNCHAMLHRETPPMSLDDLRDVLLRGPYQAKL